ncbi:SurA N-terminal domain-containing protein [Nocardioides sp. 616]|uniref:SurA N-terminal domain-containing protein n=1 Tax=Nocardioides sp. 616 TaxID=2268090 RepID=UPI000CE415E9|nr:SurA N-terminal domain-containing protein [Nocardioides sp. 616]
MNYSTRTKTALGASLAAALLALTACGGNDQDSDSKTSSEESSAQAESGDAQQPPGPDLEGIPDVVAEVNGEELTKDEFVPIYEVQFRQASMQAQMSGEEPDEDAIKKQTAEGLVGTELLRQEADDRGISASEEDVEETLTDLAEQNQMGSVDELFEALEKQGTSEELARSQVETQVVVERLVEDEVGSVKPTERELRKIYAAAVLQQKKAGSGAQDQPIPSFAEVKPQLVEQAETEREGKAAQTLVEELREDAEITINL